MTDYDLKSDPNETTDIANSKPDLIVQAADLLSREVYENDNFPLTIPGIQPVKQP